MRPARLPIAVLACASLAGCLQEQRYAVERESVWLRDDAEPAFFDEDDDPVFVSQRRFELQIRPPKQQSLDMLARSASGMELPFPRFPWVERDDLELQLDYALENHSEERLSVLVFVDGINEFHEYTPGPEDFHQWERRIEVGPGERVSASISELELDEVAIDLATVVNGAPNSNLVVQFQSQSGRDPRVKEFIPKVIPGLVALRMGVQTGTAAELALRLSVRVQDHGDRVAERGAPRWRLPTPEPFVPVAPEEEP
jgi:hypothetical protein